MGNIKYNAKIKRWTKNGKTLPLGYQESDIQYNSDGTKTTISNLTRFWDGINKALDKFIHVNTLDEMGHTISMSNGCFNNSDTSTTSSCRLFNGKFCL